jgi:hypothetical protein
MFVRRLKVERVAADGSAIPCPIAWIDNFAMRNFTNDAVFDDTLPVADGLLEAGFRVPLNRPRARNGRLVPAQGLSRGGRGSEYF